MGHRFQKSTARVLVDDQQVQEIVARLSVFYRLSGSKDQNGGVLELVNYKSLKFDVLFPKKLSVAPAKCKNLPVDT